jgi:two-component system, NarL family, response regulator YdfI
MRVLLVGSAPERTRLRSQLDTRAIDVVAEFPSLASARLSELDADAILLAPDADQHDESVVEALTPREVQVLELLAEGLPNKAIAGRLKISDQTVKFHVASISGKLGAVNRTDAVRRAVRRGLIAL